MQLQIIQKKIHEIRGVKVMLDYDLADLYMVETRVLKQAVKRNMDRFPSDFMFELTRTEYDSLRSQIVILENGRGKFSKFNPFAFTEQGVAMLSSVLRSKKAIATNIGIMRAFVLMRQYALTHKDLTEKIAELENKFEKKFTSIYEVIDYLLKRDLDKKVQSARKKLVSGK